MSKLAHKDVQIFLQEAVDSFPHEACSNCECFLGYVTRLRLDSDKADRDLMEQYQVERNSIHNCLGCDPCPPGNLYAAYVRRNQQPLITR